MRVRARWQGGETDGESIEDGCKGMEDCHPNLQDIHGEKCISKLYFFYKKIHYFYSDAGTHSKCMIFTVLNSTF